MKVIAIISSILFILAISPMQCVFCECILPIKDNSYIDDDWTKFERRQKKD